ncbi:MAG: excinuclease ABC subunit C, partial [Candidatus Chloroheliales bacterium]
MPDYRAANPVREQLEKRVRELPLSPGVYIMKNVNGEIIYVGKAVVLRHRVRSYFGSLKNQANKVAKMVANIADFEYIVTDTELEALILENNLIKQHKP